jgi:signal transduction histidine kinase
VAQQELKKLGGRLIEAEEKERSRIARELHDDIGQRLALLSIQLDHSIRTSEPSRAKAGRRHSEIERLTHLKQAAQNCTELASIVHALSHELHSSTLDLLGLASAVSDFCRQFSEQHSVTVDCTTTDIPNPLPGEVSLCLFRVVQEGLRNALKYSGVSYFEVLLRGTTDAIELEVRDRGVGFDTGTISAKGGLGLLSMRERVQLVKGTISIESQPNRGTTIVLRIPIATHVQAEPAA